jgi:hypothetical protein
MRQIIEEIYESRITHNTFLDKESVINAMTDSYQLGKEELINWLSEKDYLTDNKEILLKEYDNQFNKKTK